MPCRRIEPCRAASRLAPLLLLAAALLRPGPAAADDNGGKPEREVTPIGQVRVRPEFRDNADFDQDRPDRQRFIGQRTRLGLDVRVNPELEGRVLAQDTRIWGVDEGGTGATGTEKQAFDLLEGYADLRWIWDLPLDLRLGRQQLGFGRERLVGALDFGSSARTFDAYKLHFAMGSVLLDLFSAKLVDTNAPRPDTTLLRSDRDRNFSGVYLAREGDRPERVELYWLRDIDKTRNVRPSEIKRHTLGTLVRYPLPASFTLEAEYAYQTGEASDSLDIAAQMLAAELAFSRKDVRDLKAAAGFDWATGDDDPADGKLETFNQLFPTGHAHLGFIDYVGRQNIQDFRGQVGARLVKSLSGTVFVHVFRLDQAQDAWFNAAGAVLAAGGRTFGPDPGRTARDLGNEVDVLFRFSGFEGAQVEGGYSRFFAGDVVSAGGFPADDSDWVYVQMKVDL